MHEERAMKKKIIDFIILNVGTLITALGIYFFKFPNHFSFGGVSGLSIIFGQLVPDWSAGTFNLVINTLFLLLGFLLLDKNFGFKTVYCSLLFSLSLKGMELWFPLKGTLTDQRLLELIFAVVIPAIGSAMLFNHKASTGGTDIIAMILKKYTRLDISLSLMAADVIIALSSFFVFGVETGLYSVLGLVTKSLVVDAVMETMNLKKSVTIITVHPHEVCRYINQQLHRGATIWDAEGAFTQQEKHVILTAMNNAQAFELRRHVKELDPSAFILITKTTEIFGRGFTQP
jgi:uncharacterized membrane-anchored protein YitT (DUF2179 family)